uniref:Membrane proteins related to metalloendopeptidases n=1 Tax=uncultured gamma proteobacterium HF0010_16J05 TaxID=710981 RepID=E0XR50_9GAMM|nr:membrane proteins related to metalloendopeptidases [uncultured gamma proteobacterium HF0010_16J05]
MQIPRLHRRLIVLLGGFLIFVGLSGLGDGSDTITSTPEPVVATFKTDPQGAIDPDAKELTSESATSETVDMVKAGDSLASIFNRNGFSAKDLHTISQTNVGKQLKDIFPGHRLSFLHHEGQLKTLTYKTDRLTSYVFQRADKGFSGEKIEFQPEKVVTYTHSTIDSSLFLASQRAGLPDNLTMRLAQIFQWDIDFVLDIRPGDEFFVLYEELYFEGELIGYGDILAAEFVNQGKRYEAVQYVTETGRKDYFTPAGVSMRKAFLRAPVEFSRISSRFNMRRLHPVRKTVRPHRGIDYAAPRGTPILAAGDGRIQKASRNSANGNYIIISHGQQFVTKYLHLSKFGRGIKTGKKVTQGQIIGYVGSTGLATGPHLHYEFLVNGVHMNPRTVALPKAQSVAQRELPLFAKATRQHSLLLKAFQQQVVYMAAQ